MLACYRRRVLGELLSGWRGDPCSDRCVCLCILTVELIIQRFKMKLFCEMCSISNVINEAVDLLLSLLSFALSPFLFPHFVFSGGPVIVKQNTWKGFNSNMANNRQ